ncbi:uncharacterized protein LOC144033417 isoform X3 [Festucalex cinctus]
MNNWRKCVFGCETFRSVFGIPKKNPFRQKWLEFIERVKVKSKNVQQQQFVCDRHFTDDCLVNLGPYKSGLAVRLRLKSDAFPTIEFDAEVGAGSKSNSVCSSGALPNLCAALPPTENEKMPIDCLPTTGHKAPKQEQSEGVSKAKNDELDRAQDQTISMDKGNVLERLQDFRGLKGFKSDTEVATYLRDRGQSRLLSPSTTKRSKLESERRRQKTRINIGAAFEKWRTLRSALGMKNDPQLALLLLERYEETRAANAPSISTPLQLPHTASTEESDSVSSDAETHYRDVLKKVCLNELKDELQRRGLDTSDLKHIRAEPVLTAPNQDVVHAESPGRRREEQSRDGAAGNNADERQQQQQQEEDEGNDLSGCREEEDVKPCVKSEPCDSESDLNIGANNPEDSAIAEMDVKREPDEKEYVHVQQESICNHSKSDLNMDAAHPKMAAIAEMGVKLESGEEENIHIQQGSIKYSYDQSKPDLNTDTSHPKMAAIAEIDVKVEADEEENVDIRQPEIKMETEDVPVTVATNGPSEPKSEHRDGSSAVQGEAESDRNGTRCRKRPREENGDVDCNKTCKEKRISSAAEIVPYAFDPESEEETEGEEPAPPKRPTRDVSQWTERGTISADEAQRRISEEEQEDFFSDSSEYSDEGDDKDFVPSDEDASDGEDTDGESSLESEEAEDAEMGSVGEADDTGKEEGWRSKNKKITWSGTNERSKHDNPPPIPSPGPTGYAIARISSPVAAFDLVFPEDVIRHVVQMTNLNGARTVKGWTELTVQELRAYLGLLILAGMYRSKNEATLSLWGKELGRPTFKQTMSQGRFGQINRSLLFDDKLRRPQRHHAEKLSPIIELWTKWNHVLPKLFNPGRELCLDEHKVAFKGRCSFKSYLSAKSARYGIRVWTLCDAETSYALTLEVDTGKPLGGAHTLNVGMGVALRLCDQYEGHTLNTGRFFTSFPLAEELKKKKIALVGTPGKNKRELPPALLRLATRQPLSSLFAFSRHLTLVSYVPKQGKNVLVLSTKHHQPDVPEGKHNKPQIILDYNKCKGAVEHLQQECGAYSCRQRALRWPMCLFYHMLDISAFNAFVLFTQVEPTWNQQKLFRRRLFLEEVAKALILPEMERRKRIREGWAEYAAMSALNGLVAPEKPRRKRRQCRYCTKKLQASHSCVKCSAAICNTHMKRVCWNC